MKNKSWLGGGNIQFYMKVTPFGESFVFWREIMDLIPFQVFFMLLILSLKYLS